MTLPNGGGTVSYRYDPFGRRIQKSGPSGTTNYVYDGVNALEEVDSSGAAIARYTQDIAIDQPFAMQRSGATSFYQQDGVGSVTALSNSAGALTQTYTFNSFGKLASASGSLTNPFQFTGREFDNETGLHHLRARYMDSQSGRFLSEDPVGTSGYASLYPYTSNNPINRFDPFGLRDILVLIWNRDLLNGSVGHVMAVEMNGDVILSQFPDCGCHKGKNETLNWANTREKEGHDPDRIFLVHVPDDSGF